MPVDCARRLEDDPAALPECCAVVGSMVAALRKDSASVYWKAALKTADLPLALVLVLMVRGVTVSLVYMLLCRSLGGCRSSWRLWRIDESEAKSSSCAAA